MLSTAPVSNELALDADSTGTVLEGRLPIRSTCLLLLLSVTLLNRLELLLFFLYPSSYDHVIDRSSGLHRAS